MHETLKIVHILAWTSWMAGLFYLPRLFVYHAERATAGGEMAETFGVMQHKLLRFIMNPAMIVTWITGLWLAYSVYGFQGGWLHAKITLVVAMTVFHMFCARWRKELAAGTSTKSGRYFRIANEVPTVIFVLVVILAILKPF